MALVEFTFNHKRSKLIMKTIKIQIAESSISALSGTRSRTSNVKFRGRRISRWKDNPNNNNKNPNQNEVSADIYLTFKNNWVVNLITKTEDSFKSELIIITDTTNMFEIANKLPSDLTKKVASLMKRHKIVDNYLDI